MISGRITITMCLASNNINTELLRTQLDQLHSEAHSTRRKANNARFRLLRLSEAAESLCRQAAKSVRMGKENDARELLMQKKKIMGALEKSKGRVELLDELAAKLNEAITTKEAQLVENVTSDLEMEGDDAERPVHIVSPTPGSMNNLNDHSDVDSRDYTVKDDQKPNPDEDPEISERLKSVPKAVTGSELTGLSLYMDFLKELDQQLNEIQKDLMAISDVSPLKAESEEVEEPNRSGLQKVFEILERIRNTRVRIQSFVEENLSTN